MLKDILMAHGKSLTHIVLDFIAKTKVEGVSQNLRLTNGHFKTTSGHLFANYIHEYLSQN